MEQVAYRKYEVSREAEVCKVLTDAFYDYPLFYGVFKERFRTEAELRSFYEKLLTSIFKATIRKNECYIGLIGETVVSIVIIDSPADKKVGFWDYAVCGMPGIIKKLGLKNTLKYMDLSDRTEEVVRSIEEPRWHLYFLAVDPKYQGNGVGSGAICDFLIPMVKNNGGNLVTVTTNSEKNVAFYLNNGFSLVKEETIEYCGNHIGNWTFRMDL